MKFFKTLIVKQAEFNFLNNKINMIIPFQMNIKS